MIADGYDAPLADARPPLNCRPSVLPDYRTRIPVITQRAGAAATTQHRARLGASRFSAPEFEIGEEQVRGVLGPQARVDAMARIPAVPLADDWVG